MHLRLLLAVALFLTAPGAGRVAGGLEPSLSALPQAGQLEELEVWAGAVETHTPGQLDEPARRIAAWPRSVLDAVFRYQKAFLVLVSEPGTADLARLKETFSKSDLELMLRLAQTTGLDRAGPRFIKHAALLHTDIALLAPDSGNAVVPVFFPTQRRRQDAPPKDGLPRRISGLSQDGRELGDQVTGAHWDIARAMLDGLKPSPASDDDARLWYRAINAVMAGYHLLADQGVHLARGRQIFPADKVLLLATGCHFETYSAAGVQAVVQAEAKTALPYSIAG